MNILFWDIDGTLLNTGRAGLFAIEEAFTTLKGGKLDIGSFKAGGKTDNYICQQLLLQATGKMPSDQEVSDFCRRYEAMLVGWLKESNGKTFDSATNIVTYFHHKKDYVQMLLTGNSAYGAKLKLDCYGLTDYFDFDHSGFAGSFYDRNDLARDALQKVQRGWGNEIENIYVIGDTQYDIKCGKVIGAKTIAVATGQYSLASLQEHDPWWAVQELPPPEEFLKKLTQG